MLTQSGAWLGGAQCAAMHSCTALTPVINNLLDNFEHWHGSAVLKVKDESWAIERRGLKRAGLKRPCVSPRVPDRRLPSHVHTTVLCPMGHMRNKGTCSVGTVLSERTADGAG